jgi:dolichol-phosphate mannosyltransferase
MDLSIIIPCYNESDNVLRMREELIPVISDLVRTYTLEIIFVDDGSTDNTLEALKNHFGNEFIPGVLVKYEQLIGNWGLGQALRKGVSVSDGELILTTDSDGTYKYSSIPALLSCLTENVDIVTASPYHPQGDVIGVPGYRLILSRGSSLIYRILVNWWIHTYTCLFRVYRRKILEEVHFVSNGFLSGTEILVKSLLEGYKVAEFPAILHTRAYGTSKAKLLRTILAHLRFQINVVLHRLHLLSLSKKSYNRGGHHWIRTKYSIFGEKIK